jgi:hypothetical protein
MEVERVRLEPADGRVVELAGDVTRHVVHPKPNDLVRNAAGNVSEPVGDEAVERARRHAIAGNGR